MYETIIPLLLGVVQGLTEFLPVSRSGRAHSKKGGIFS